MRGGRLDRVVQLDIGQLGAADDAFLRFGRQRVPPGHIVQVFLHDDIAAAGEGGIFLADQRGVDRRRAARVFGPIDEAQQVAGVEIAEAVHLVDASTRHRPVAS